MRLVALAKTSNLQNLNSKIDYYCTNVLLLWTVPQQPRKLVYTNHVLAYGGSQGGFRFLIGFHWDQRVQGSGGQGGPCDIY